MGASTNQSERRVSERLLIEREAHYRVLGRKSGEVAAFGKTVNVSGSGILFTTEHLLIPGERLELAVNWPAQLNNKSALKLVARGSVVRCDNGLAALVILQHEFRVRPNGSPLIAQTPARAAS
jgi:PilZ domain-containing protein